MPVQAKSPRSWGSEKILSFSELAKQPDLPIKRTHWALRRWAVDGVAVKGCRQRIKLAFFEIAGVRHSSVQAVREFIAALGGNG
jgi:hypothetical protein